MKAQWFFKLFPPPVFLTMPYAGLEISDDALRCLAFSGYGKRGRKVSVHGSLSLPAGLIEGGDIKDDKALIEKLSGFRDKHGLGYVKVSIPEEKAYLFQTDIPDDDIRSAEQNIEFKLEENVPLSADDAVFYFAIMPRTFPGGSMMASVSVVPRTYIERMMAIIEAAGMKAAAFEVVPRSVSRAVVPAGYDGTKLIVHVMGNKTGIYISQRGIVSFSSTMAGGADDAGTDRGSVLASLDKEIVRVSSYWMSHGSGSAIDGIVLAGRADDRFTKVGQSAADTAGIPVASADVWANSIDVEMGVPPIPKQQSLEYAAAIGLALDPTMP